MRPDLLRLREAVGIAFASAMVAIPAGSLLGQELAEQWNWAAAHITVWSVIVLTWVALTALAGEAVWRLGVDQSRHA